MNFFDAICNVNGDKVDLQIGNSHFELPPEKAQKLISGGYAGKTVILGIRPEDVHEATEADRAGGRTIPCVIKFYELLGAEVYLYFDLEGMQMTARTSASTKLRTGSDAEFSLDMNKVHVFDKESQITITN